MKEKANTLDRQYQQRFADTYEYRNRVWTVLCSGYFCRYISSDSTILDLGAGWGEFVNNIEANKKYAMDLNPATKEHLKADVSFIHHDCTAPWPLASESLDVVFTSNFLEHLPDKKSIELTASEAHRCLKEGGQFICLGPNTKFVPGTYWDFWDHYIPLTDMSVAELLVMSGFDIEERIPRFLPYSMSTGSTPPLLFVELYLKLPILWPLFGKQFLVTARKKSAAKGRS